MTSRVGTFIAVLACICMSINAFCADAAKPSSTFTQSVIHKAISFMPDDVKTKLSASEKDIVSDAKSVYAPKQSAQEITYFVDKGQGNGPESLADQFRLARKKIAEKSTAGSLSTSLGKLAGTVIALCEPYHTSESVFKAAAHADFESKLNTGADSLKAEFDGFQKVDNPSDFAIQLAKRANELLPKEGAESPSQSEVYSLAVNSVADCWWTLLANQGSKGTEETPSEGGFIGNKRSLKFHRSDCKYMPAEKNRIYFKTRDEAVSQGYEPCKVCKP